jgi:hypothetical protein
MGADRAERLEVALRRLRYDDLLGIEDRAATDRNVRRLGERLTSTGR